MMESEPVEERLHRLGDVLDTERELRRGSAGLQSGGVGDLGNARPGAGQRWRRLVVAGAAIVVLVVGAVGLWPSDSPTEIEIISDQTTTSAPPPATSAEVALVETPTTSTIVEFEPGPASPVGDSCVQATLGYFELFAGSGVFERYEPRLREVGRSREFAELVMPVNEAGSGFVFVFVDETRVLCRLTGDLVEHLNIGDLDSGGNGNSDIWGLGASSGVKNPTGGDSISEFRVVGRASPDVQKVAVVLASGLETRGVLRDGWFIVEARGITGSDRVSDQVVGEGSAGLRWEKVDGEVLEESLFEISGRGGPPNTTPLPRRVLGGLTILNRPLTESDALPAGFIDPPGAGPSSFADYGAARRGAERDGVVIWVSPTDPVGGYCTFVSGPEIGTMARGCGYGPIDETTLINTFGMTADSQSDIGYVAGTIISEDVVDVIGATVVDRTFVFTYNPQTYNGELGESGTPVLSLRLIDGTVVQYNN